MPNIFENAGSTPWSDLLAASIVQPQDLPARLTEAILPHHPAADLFPMKVNPYVLSLIRSADDGIGRQFLPHAAELADADGPADPLAEEGQSPAPLVIHRYPHRVVLLVSDQCAVHCRYCMRKRRVADPRPAPRELIDQGVAYIRGTPRINEVILSGGDPLMLPDDRLMEILQALQGIPQVRCLRIHTRMPGVCPQRVTESLARRIAAFHPIYINIQFNHPRETTAAAMAACRRLADAGIPLGSQSVLLKGINDDAEILRELMETLLVNRVRPYYIHQVDHVPGAGHFQVPVQRALQIMTSLRGRLSGMAVPHFMIDLPGGGGKVALTPEAVVAKQSGQWLIRNWEGRTFTYPCR